MKILLIFAALLFCFYMPVFLYFRFGLFKKWYHDILGWHTPSDEEGFDGCSFTSVCKHCGKSIMQDSQGNWF